MTEYRTPRFFYGWVIVIVSFFILIVSRGPGMHSFGVFFRPLLIEFAPAFWVYVAIGSIVLVLTLLLKPLGDEEGSQ